MATSYTYATQILKKLTLLPVTNDPELKRLLDPIHVAIFELVRRLEAGIGSGGQGCSLILSTGQGTTGTVIFDDDTFSGGHNDSALYDTATGQATIPSGGGGDYLVLFSGNGTITVSPGPLVIQLLVNSTPVISREHNGNDIGATGEITISTVLRLAAGDVVEISISSVSGNVLAAGASFAMKRLS